MTQVALAWRAHLRYSGHMGRAELAAHCIAGMSGAFRYPPGISSIYPVPGMGLTAVDALFNKATMLSLCARLYIK